LARLRTRLRHAVHGRLPPGRAVRRLPVAGLDLAAVVRSLRRGRAHGSADPGRGEPFGDAARIGCMFGLDSWIAALGAGHPLILATVVAVLLGLRHAPDPDHISAVTTLVAGERDRRVAHAARMGLAWGAGHATSLFLFGLPIVLFAGYLPGAAQSSAEAAVGVMSVVLALRLLVRCRGAYHLHEHDHEGDSHLHLHGHAESSTHAHHSGRSVRTPLGAYATGL